MTTREKFLAKIEAYLVRHNLSAPEFGELCMRDRSFVQRIRNGRSPRSDTMDHVVQWMRDRPLGHSKTVEARSAA